MVPLILFMKRIIIAGASGMVGNLVLKKCLSISEVSEVISLVRKNSTFRHPKLKEVVLDDFSDYSTHKDLFLNIDAVFFCIGVYTGSVPDKKFRAITIDYPYQLASILKANSPSASFCLLSGAGADRTEKSKTAFARYKGMAENKISQLGLRFFAFRPGYIYPTYKRKEPNLMYKILRWLYPIIKLMGSSASIQSTDLANAMVSIGLGNVKKEILENQDILEYA